MVASRTLDPLLSAPEVAQWLRVPVATLHQWRHKGVGPRAFKVGRHLRYQRAEVEAWLESRADAA